MREYWSDVEIAWTVLSALNVPAALYGIWDAVCDLRAAYRRRSQKRLLAAWWWLLAAVLFVLIFVGFMLLGILAGLQPPRLVQVGEIETASSTLSSVVVFVVGGMASVCLWLGLWIRYCLRMLPLDPMDMGK